MNRRRFLKYAGATAAGVAASAIGLGVVESYLFCSLTVVRLVIRMRAASLVVGKFSSGCGLIACILSIIGYSANP